MPSMSGGVFLSNPCNPAVRHCLQHCTNGYMLGSNNCQYCSCKDSPGTMNVSSSTSKPVGNIFGLQNKEKTSKSDFDYTPSEQLFIDYLDLRKHFHTNDKKELNELPEKYTHQNHHFLTLYPALELWVLVKFMLQNISKIH